MVETREKTPQVEKEYSWTLGSGHTFAILTQGGDGYDWYRVTVPDDYSVFVGKGRIVTGHSKEHPAKTGLGIIMEIDGKDGCFTSKDRFVTTYLRARIDFPHPGLIIGKKK